MAHAPHGYPQGRCTPRPPLHRQVRLRLCRLTVRWIGSDTVAAAISSAACALRRRAHDLFAACGVGVVGQNGQPEALPAMVHGQVYERSRLGGSADRLASHGYPCVPLRIGTRPADGSFTATFGALNPTRLSRGARGLPGTVAYSCAPTPVGLSARPKDSTARLHAACSSTGAATAILFCTSAACNTHGGSLPCTCARDRCAMADRSWSQARADAHISGCLCASIRVRFATAVRGTSCMLYTVSQACVPDLVRYICGVFHPPNSLIQSDVIPR